MIITDAALAPSFQPLINQKIADGLTATIVTTDAYGNYTGIYANYTGTESHANDVMGAAGLEADQIRQFIADAYANWGTRWVLLGGDTSVIPMRTVYADADGQAIDDTLPTDEYYACPNGPWDSSGDPYWGETDDGAGGGDIDLMPEVYVGRAPVENPSETANFVDKTIQNETTENPNPDTSLWLADQLNPDTDAGVVNQDIINAVLPASWNASSNLTSYDVSPNSWGNGYGETNIVSLLNAGPTIVNSLGHSNATDDSGIVLSDVAGLTNSFPYFMYSEGCDAGAMDQADPCIAAEQVDAVHAALGVVMNTQFGWYLSGGAMGLSSTYALDFWQGVFDAGLVSPGQANAYSKVVNLASAYSDGAMRWIGFETTLYGDPQTPLQVGPTGAVRGTVQTPGGQGVAGDAVFLDMNQNGTLDSSTANPASTDVPVKIPGRGTFSSTLSASSLPGLITDITVTLNITYGWDSDVTATLISPTGTSVQLFSGVGGTSANFTNTTLDDQAADPISLATAPFTGVFLPTGGLAQFNGEAPNGTWTLQVSTQYGFSSGALNSWSMHIASAEPSAVTAVDGSYEISNLPDGTYNVDLVPQSGWTDTNPAFQQVTISNGAIVSNVNFVTTDGTASQPPVLTGIEAGALAYTEGDPATAVTSALTVSDAESGTLIGATVWISDDYQSGQDVLGFINAGDITGAWNAATGILTLSGSDTLADYQAALQAVTYQDTSANPSGTARAVSFEVNDGLGDSNVVTRSIVLQAPNPAEMTVQIGSGATAVVADRGTSATLAVWIMDSAQGLQSADLTITYDTSRFTVAESGVTASTYLANFGWTVTPTVDGAAGTIAVSLSGGTALPAGTAELVDLTFQVLATAIGGDSPLVLVVSGGAASELNGGSVAVTPVDGNLAVFATDTWNGGTAGNFSDQGNWVSGVAPSTAGDDLVLGVPGFGGPTASSPVNDFPAGTLFHSLTLIGGCTLSGNSALLDSTGSTTILSQDGNTLSLPLVLAADGTFEDSGARLQSRARSTTPAIC